MLTRRTLRWQPLTRPGVQPFLAQRAQSIELGCGLRTKAQVVAVDVTLIPHPTGNYVQIMGWNEVVGRPGATIEAAKNAEAQNIEDSVRLMTTAGAREMANQGLWRGKDRGDAIQDRTVRQRDEAR